MASYPQTVTEQSLPSSPHAEITILGAMLVEPDTIIEAIDILDPEDFSLDSHRRIYAAILHLSQAGHPVDIVTVGDRLRKKKELESIGGISYLASLSEGLPRKLSIESYVRIVKDKSRLREAMSVASMLTEAASDQSEESGALIQRAQYALQSIIEDGEETQLQSVGDFFDDQGDPESMFEVMATVNGIDLGFNQLHEVTGGPQPGELWIVAARPSMGKTAWMCNVSRYAAVQAGKIPAVFTLEQKKQAAIRRMLSASARIDYKDIRRNELRRQDRALLLEHRSILSRAPLYIDDQPGLTVTRIKARCVRLKRKVGLDIVFIDQLSHVSTADCKERDFRLKVGEQTKALKRMAQELNIPVIVFNQLSREAGKRKDFVPTLADLKESGNIEEDADVVCLLHRPEYYDKSDASLAGLGQIIVAKNREGETKTLNCVYQGRIMRWEDDTETPAHQDSFYERAPW